MIEADFEAHIDLVRQSIPTVTDAIADAATVVSSALGRGGQLIAFGNGGSAADAQHLVAELVGHFSGPRRGFRAIALTTDGVLLTSIGNDLGFADVFARQVDTVARSGDVAVALSTSGTSPNVVNAAGVARDRGCAVIAFTGRGGGDLAAIATTLIEVPSTDVARIQEVHALALHALVARVQDLVEPAEENP